MRKRILDTRLSVPSVKSQFRWLDLAQIATVEVTSEDPRYPIESVFTNGDPGWRAGQTGQQQIRLIFDEPVSVRHIQLRFEADAGIHSPLVSRSGRTEHRDCSAAMEFQPGGLHN